MGANFTHFDTLAKHASVNTKKFTVLLSVLIEELENRLQDFKKKHRFFFFPIFAISFLVDINTCTKLKKKQLKNPLAEISYVEVSGHLNIKKREKEAS